MDATQSVNQRPAPSSRDADDDVEEVEDPADDEILSRIMVEMGQTRSGARFILAMRRGQVTGDTPTSDP